MWVTGQLLTIETLPVPHVPVGQRLTIETYLLSNLEGAPPQQISVEFLRWVREEKKFPSPESLKAQILRDVGRAQTYFRRLKRSRDSRRGLQEPMKALDEFQSTA
jgi:hypothetical protein